MTDTLQLDLSPLLPDVTDAHDACLVRLISTLEAHQGIGGVHILEGLGHAPIQLCVHHDASLLPAHRLADLVATLSETLHAHFGHLSVQLASSHYTCEATERLRRLSGVRSVESTADGHLRIEYNRDRTSAEAVREVLQDVTHKNNPACDKPRG